MGVDNRSRRGRVVVLLRSHEALSAQMTERDVSITELAKATGYSRGYIQHLHMGRHNRVSKRLATAIETALECPGKLFLPLMDGGFTSETHPDGATAGAA